MFSHQGIKLIQPMLLATAVPDYLKIYPDVETHISQINAWPIKIYILSPIYESLNRDNVIYF